MSQVQDTMQLVGGPSLAGGLAPPVGRWWVVSTSLFTGFVAGGTWMVSMFLAALAPGNENKLRNGVQALTDLPTVPLVSWLVWAAFGVIAVIWMATLRRYGRWRLTLGILTALTAITWIPTTLFFMLDGIIRDVSDLGVEWGAEWGDAVFSTAQVLLIVSAILSIWWLVVAIRWGKRNLAISAENLALVL